MKAFKDIDCKTKEIYGNSHEDYRGGSGPTIK